MYQKKSISGPLVPITVSKGSSLFKKQTKVLFHIKTLIPFQFQLILLKVTHPLRTDNRQPVSDQLTMTPHSKICNWINT